jgi:hypothetical protein
MVSVHHHRPWFSQLLPTCKPANWYGFAMALRFTAPLPQLGRHWGAMVAFDLLQLTKFTTTPIIMNFPYLNNSQVEELNEFGVIELTDELMAIINQWGSDDDSESNLD